MSTLLIVESPSKASTIQNYLGNDYVVMASKGHIADLISGGNHGIGVDIEKNFKPKYALLPDKIELLDQIMKAAKNSDLILLGTDPDREGEAISWHLYSRLADLEKPMKRVVFTEITKSILLKAIKNARDIDMNLFHAQEARRILDRIVGFMASPFLMNQFGNKLSAGRVQSVVTRMIIDRENEIQTFVPEIFWNISSDFVYDNKKINLKLNKKITSEKIANSTVEKINSTKDFIVSKVIAEEELKQAPPPLITSTLQQLMSKSHNMSPDRTMKAAQGLYECGHCSYIRTDSVRIGDEAIDSVREYLKSNNFDLPSKKNMFKNKSAAQDAHEAIRPTDVNLIPNKNYDILDQDERLVYEMIWKYFVASQMKPAVYNTLKVTIQSSSDPKLEFKVTGKALKYKGFIEVLGGEETSSLDLPNFKEGEAVNLIDKSTKLEKKQTQPPARFSEAKLIKELDNKNIGRPATYAELLSKICSRNYVEKKGNMFYPTDLGKNITNMLKDYFTFMDYNYTKMIEEKLDEVEQGKVDHVQMLSEFYPSFKSELDKAYVSNGGTLCEKCSSPMVKRESRDKVKFLACSRFPQCKSTKNLNSPSETKSVSVGI